MTGADDTVSSIARELGSEIAADVLTHEPMSGHTTFGLGGPADLFVRITSEQDLQSLLQFAQTNQLPVTVIGAGSNILVSDLGVRGVVIALSGGLSTVNIDEGRVTAGAGAGLSAAIAATSGEGLSGLHRVYGVPGSVGGAVFMNAGTRYGSISDTIVSARLMALDGKSTTADADELGLGYRHSALQDMVDPPILLSADFDLERRDSAEVKREIDQMAEARKQSQPLNWRSCGCMFRNPPADSAGRLIDISGLKGASVGGVSVSDRHANFFVTRGGATSSDVLSLTRLVQSKVMEETGVLLQLEVRLIGEWPDE